VFQFYPFLASIFASQLVELVFHSHQNLIKMAFISIKKTQRLALSLLIFSATLLTAQTHTETGAHRCGTEPMTAEQIRYTLDVVAKKVVLRNAGMTCVPIQAFIVREDDGSGGMTYDQLNKGLANLNYLYQPANIEFYWANVPQYANNSDYAIYDPISKGHTKAGLKALFNDAQTALSIYFTKSLRSNVSGNIIGGYSQGPGNDVETNFIHLEYAAFTYSVWSTGAHEMGHYFNLAHTFNYTESGNAGTNAENVARSGVQKNCDVAGDFVCDTDADPRYNTLLCNNNGNAAGNLTDRFGVAYTPPFNNLMSYYDYACRNDNVVTLTPQQYTRIAQALATRLTHTAYRLNASPMNVNNPSNLAATQIGLSVVLNWTDNANNEMGYLIERSTASNNSGFKALKYGSTADNITTFTDNDVVLNTTYYYRIKASNDDCNDYSNAVTITPQPVYCLPAYTTTCALDGGNTPKYLAKFALKTSANAILFNNDNNGCAGVLSDFTNNAAFSANVTAGTTYNFDVRLAQNPTGGSYYAQNIGVWLDINNDKDFDDAGENLGIFTHAIYGSSANLAGSFTIPATTTNGARRLRIKSGPSNWNMTSTSICSNFGYGETEDYTLNVSGGIALPIRLSRFQGKNTEGGNQLTWDTESEVNAAYFEVEKSLNNQNFDKIATVKAIGKANTYVLDDKNGGQNTHYYRLKMVDNDGAFQYSKIIALNSEKNNNKLLNIYPNPATQLLTIETTEEGDRQVVNLLGQIVQRSKATQQIDVSALPSGTYFLKIGGQQARFVKQ
jgi:hypothetical protein